MGKVAKAVASLRAGVSPVSDGKAPDPDEYGVLELSAVTRGQICRARAKRLPPTIVQTDWPRIRKGTILVCRASGNRALVGACTMATDDFPNLMPPDTAWVVDVVDHFPARVLVEYLQSDDGRRAIERIARGTNGTWKISQKSFLSLPLPEISGAKKAVIERLAEAFVLRSRFLEALITERQALRRGLAQHLLIGAKRFPKFQGKAWKEVRLGDVFDERSEVNRGDLPLLSVTGDRGVVLRDELAKRDTSNPDKSKYKRVTVGDIAYNTMRMWQGVSALSALEGIVSPAYTVIVPGKRIDGRFAKHLFKLPAVVHLFHRHSQGLVDDTLNLKYNHFARIRLRIPSDVAEQRRIADVLDLCDAELALLERQRDLYVRYKRGLMARLLSGEIKVPA